jgi:hypothetical protein
MKERTQFCICVRKALNDMWYAPYQSLAFVYRILKYTHVLETLHILHLMLQVFCVSEGFFTNQHSPVSHGYASEPTSTLV